MFFKEKINYINSIGMEMPSHSAVLPCIPTMCRTTSSHEVDEPILRQVSEPMEMESGYFLAQLGGDKSSNRVRVF
jgi:hypothetical protein